MTKPSASVADPEREFLAALAALEAALSVCDWPAAAAAAERVESAAQACTSARVALAAEPRARAVALTERCAERLATAQASALGELAALGSAGRARGRYHP